MKNTLICNLVLLLSIFLWNCSDGEEEQYVKEEWYITPSETLIETDYKGGTFYLDVDANCKWEVITFFSLSFSEEWATVMYDNTKQKEAISIHIHPNTWNDSRNFYIKLYSKENDAYAIVNISQDYGPRYDTPSLESKYEFLEEGGTYIFQFTIYDMEKAPNIQIRVDAPDWITIEQGKVRSTETYTYSAIADKNETGCERKGVIELYINDKLSGSTEVNQKGFQPKSVEILGIENHTVFNQHGEIVYKLALTPKYADPSRCSVSSMDENIAEAWVEDRELHINYKDYGEFNVRFWMKDCQQDITLRNINPVFDWDMYFNEYYCVGTNIYITTNLHDREYVLTSSDTSIASVSDASTISLLAPGEFVITAKSNYTGQEITKAIKVKDVILQSNVLWFAQKEDYMYDITFKGHAYAGNSIKNPHFQVLDSNGIVIDNGEGYTDNHGQYVRYTSKTIQIKWENYPNILEQIKDYKMVFIGQANGRECKEIVEIDTYYVGD